MGTRHYFSYSPDPVPLARTVGSVLRDVVVTTSIRTLVFAAALYLGAGLGDVSGARAVLAVGVLAVAAVAMRAVWVWLVTPAESAGGAG